MRGSERATGWVSGIWPGSTHHTSNTDDFHTAKVLLLKTQARVSVLTELNSFTPRADLNPIRINKLDVLLPPFSEGLILQALSSTFSRLRSIQSATVSTI